MKELSKASILFVLFLLSLSMSVNAQWETVYWFNIPQLNAVRFKDFNHGMTVGIDYILRTADNGTTWDSVFTAPHYTYFTDVVYVDSITIIAVGHGNSRGLIARSTDDGTTWDTISINEGLLTMSFPSKNIGYTGGYDGIIYKTTDKGNSWAPLPSFTSSGISALFFVNDTIGFANADSLVFKTTNGGNSWTSTNIHYSNCKIFFSSDSIGYIVSGRTIIKTFNMGASWSEYGDNSTITAPLYDLFFVDDLLGYACGFFQVVKTTDGGLTWVQQSASAPSYYDFMDSELGVYFLNKDTGFVVGTATFYRTTIGGITGVNNYDIKTGISVYPNPFINTAIISFDYKENEKYLLNIYNISGQKVLENSDINNGQIRIDRKGMADGLYFFQLQNSKGIVGSGKLIIE